MALDPNVVFRTAPVANPDDIIKAQDAIQTIQQKNQATRQAALDDAALRHSLQVSGGDPVQASTWLKANNYGPVAMKLDDAVAKQRDTLSQAAEREVKAQADKTQFWASSLNAVTPENLPAAESSILGGIPGDEFQRATIKAAYDAAPTPAAKIQALKDSVQPVQDYYKVHQQAVQAMAKGDQRSAVGYSVLGTHSQQDYDGMKQFMASYHDPAIDAELAKLPDQWTPDVPKLGASMTISPEEQAKEAGLAAARAQTAKNEAANLAISQGRLTVAQQRESREAAAAKVGATAGIDPNAPHGDDFLKTLSPSDQAMVKSLAEGRQAFPASFALSKPYWQDILAKVYQYDPTMDTATVSNNARVKVRTDFTSGKSAQTINALNTVVGHLSNLADQGAQLGNTSSDLVNSVRNWLTPGGSARGVTINNFDTAKQAVADELTRVYRQAGGSEADIKGWQSTINAAKSPAELKGAWTTIGNLLESKLESMQNQYQQGMGTTPVNIVTPQTRGALDKLKGGGTASSKPPQNPKSGDHWQSPKGMATFDGSAWVVK